MLKTAVRSRKIKILCASLLIFRLLITLMRNSEGMVLEGLSSLLVVDENAKAQLDWLLLMNWKM